MPRRLPRRSLPLLRLLAGLAGVLLAAASASPVAADDDGGFTIQDPRINESSGLAASRQHPGIYWTHNDQDTGAYLYAVDSKTGRTVATITMTGVGTPRDVEAISIGPDNQIWVGDIGDNDGVTWPYVWIYRLPEPKELKDQSIRATQYVVKYSDGSRDAESMVVHPRTGRVYIIDKQEDGGHLYEGPAELSTSGTNVYRPVAPVDLWATDAAFSPDGKRLAVRGYFGGILYDWNDGKIKRIQQLSVPLQRQGESVTYTTDGSKIMYGSEGEGSTVVARDAPGGGSGGSESSSGGEGSEAGGGDGDGVPSSGFTAGALAVAAGVVVLWVLKRLRRRPS
ncbi:WD40 repeat domain-containing protein [Streptomyces sp. KM273126]|uniref:WD40 repeat domain-containing protein n=1 Tax=Streptomyces sp. KM273126 TaxID=2545247 RepID=UPI00103F9E79|nr:WD40 repeat domain-containing protein [Streptomyces sp. KM273126]MBA2807087.1 WD40 repeat domain-containing protein [Streptomyces sp. KM273126]